MTDEVIPLDELGKQGTVKVYNQAYVEKLQKENEELKKEAEEIKCVNCVNFSEPYELCCYSLGDEDYYCRGRKMTDKDEIKFVIRYLKKGLKSKRTP